MITAGRNIISSSDLLVQLEVSQLVKSLKCPKDEVKKLIEQMRTVRGLSVDSYNSLKRNLPYFVCSVFTPLYRRTENFAYTLYFVLDIDHLSRKGLVLSELREKLQQDDRVLMCFTSPSGDGLKVMFELKEKCYDAGTYKLFYKLFATSFSLQYNLQQAVDTKTCDVTRACFISYDPDVYFNPLAECIDLEKIVSENNDQQKWDLLQEVKTGKVAEEEVIVEEEQLDKTINKENMDKIKEYLGTARQKMAIKSKVDVYVPEILNDILDELKSFIMDSGVELVEAINIQYGKKLRFMYQDKEAETNLYYGKRGFSVVETPRSGTDAELNALMADMVRTYVNTL